MKRIRNLFLILMLSIATVFCVTACNGEDGKEDPSGPVSYEIAVDASKVSVDINEISVCLYSLDGTLVGEKKLSQGKTLFELDADSYVATLSGLSEEVSYSSVLLTKNSKKAKIILEKSVTVYNEFEETYTYNFAFTVIVMAGDRKLADLDVQICDDSLCTFVTFKNGNVADRPLSTGEYKVEVYTHSNGFRELLYHENYTVTLDKRFCVIVL